MTEYTFTQESLDLLRKEEREQGRKEVLDEIEKWCIKNHLEVNRFSLMREIKELRGKE